MRSRFWTRSAGRLACGVACTVLLFASAATQPILAQESKAPEPIADAAIVLAITEELRSDDGVAAHRVDIASTDGVVTLTGQVDNLLARERAAEIAMATRGVRSVANAIEVMPSERSPAQIRADVVRALLLDPATESYEIDVTVTKDGTVILDGTVDSWAERTLCGQVARSVRGVRAIRDDINVEFDKTRSDSEIRMDVVHRLANDVRVDEGLIDVDVQDRVVRLTGSVGSAAERQRARSNAWVLGAQSVDASDLEVRWWLRDEMRRISEFEARSDEDIREAIVTAFQYDPRVLSFKPNIEVDRGIVTLTGRVSNLEAKRAAAETAQNTLGVLRVKNYLLVRTNAEVPDGEIERQILDGLERNPYTDPHEISVTSVHGAVTLRGVVDSRFDKHQVIKTAARVRGVLDIEDRIEVGQNWSYMADWAIEDEIRSQLWWSPFVDEDEVNVEVEDGVATLTGTVDHWGEWKAAEDNAFDGGAWKVRNKLEVRHSPLVLR